MNILFLSKEYPPETGWGGIGTYVYNIVHALSKNGHTIHIITLAYTSCPGYKEEINGKGSIHIHRIRPVRFPALFLNRYFFKSLEIIKFNVAIILKIRELIKNVKLDIIEAPEWRSEAFLLSFIKPKGIPLIIKCHSPSILLNEIYNPPSLPFNKRGAGGVDSRLVDWIERTTVRDADLIVSPSRSLAAIVSEKMEIKMEDIKIIPNPLDSEAFSPLPQTIQQIDKGLKVLFVGRLDRLKGVHIFVEAIPIISKEMPDTSFILIGRDTNTGPNNSSMKAYLENLIQNNIKDRVSFLGNVERDKLIDYYRESDVCVVPSFYENLPNTVLEAMSCGKAVVASNTGGIPEVIEEGISGLMVKIGDADDLAEKIIRLLKDKNMREILGANARKRIEEKYSKNIVAKEVEEVYQKLISV